MDFNKRRIAVNAFFMAHFKCCPFIWMCHNRTYTNKINRLHERCLRLIYDNKRSSLEGLFEKDNVCLYTPQKSTSTSNGDV